MTASKVRYQADIPVFNAAGAPCVDDPEAWFPFNPDGMRARVAVRKCLTQCPHLSGCLIYAIACKPSHGIWAGHTAEEIRVIVKQGKRNGVR
jgi:transcription factor WhiB